MGWAVLLSTCPSEYLRSTVFSLERLQLTASYNNRWVELLQLYNELVKVVELG